MKNSCIRGRILERAQAVAKLALALLLVSTMVVYVPALPSQAYAASGPVGSIEVDGKTTQYSTYAELAHALENLAFKEVTIDMARDWRKIESTNGFPHLVIPVDADVTLNMNGHKIDKMGITEASADMKEENGEVILVMNGASLVINGGTKERSHSVQYYDSTAENASPTTATRSGGVITGGSSTSGSGGIVVWKGGSVELNDVTIVGCRARRYDDANGNGGGIYVLGAGTILRLNNSTVEGCYAGTGGGGIYIEEYSKLAVFLSNSHIDNNRTSRYGGGICTLGSNVKITGDAESTVSDNQADMRGGGIEVWEGATQLNGFAVRNNKAAQGGGLDIKGDPYVLNGLVIEGNVAERAQGVSSSGGGIYIYPGPLEESINGYWYSEIRDCTITGNTASDGAGVWVDDDYSSVPSDKQRWETKLVGNTVIKDNIKASGGTYSDSTDLFIFGANYDGVKSGWAYKSISFDLGSGAEVWVGYFGTNTGSLPEGAKLYNDSDCAQYVHSNKAGYAFDYVTYNEGDASDAPIARIIDLVNAPGAFEKVTVSAGDANDAYSKDNSAQVNNMAGIVGTVGVGGVEGADYDLVRGFYMHDHETTLALFYYSDGLFYGDPYTYNTHLATASWGLAYVGGYLDDNKDAWNDGNIYYNKHAAARQFFADIGCPDNSIYVNDDMIGQPGTDTIGMSIASKELRYASTVGENGEVVPGEKTGDILIPVTVRGLGYGDEWVSNVTLGYAEAMAPGAEAKGFSEAADEVLSEIEFYLHKYGLEDAFKEGHVKFWVTGYSRAGATANLVSKRLVDKIEAECTGDEKSQVFGYPCEAPKGGTDLADEGLKHSDTRYFCIHNLINRVDFVPYVAPEQMGFKRYGVDHYIPGGEAGEITTTQKAVRGGGDGGPTAVTTYADNEAWLTSDFKYVMQKYDMLEQLKAVDSGMSFNDAFITQSLDLVHRNDPTSGWSLDISFFKMYQHGSGTHIEYFLDDFVRFVQEGLDGDGKRGAALPSRDYYARDSIYDGYQTIEDVARNLMLVFRHTDDAAMGGFIDSAGNIKDLIAVFDFGEISRSRAYQSFSLTYPTLYRCLKEWYNRSEGQKNIDISQLWDAFKKTGALDKLDADAQQKVKAAFPTLAYVGMTLANADYVHYPTDTAGGEQWVLASSETMMLIPTFLGNASYILKCHAPQINIAWTRTYDSWYMDNDEYSEYVLERPGSVEAPKAYGSTVAGEQVALESGSGKNNSLTGDQAIILENSEIAGEAIYYKLQGGDSSSGDQLYHGGIHLALGNDTEKSYTITAYTFSYGVKSAEVTYEITLGSDDHKVIVKDLEPDETDGSSSGLSGTSISGASTATASGSDGDGLSLMAGHIADSSFLSTATSETPRRQEFTYAEGDIAFVEAGVPASKYFKNWKVTLSEDGGSDLADNLTWGKGGEATKPAAFFTMPMTSETFPANYDLVLDAQYGDRLDALTAAVKFPAAGQTLPSSMKVGDQQQDYPIEWTYADGDGNEVLTSGEAYNDTVYIAKVTVPQDVAKELVFMPNVTVTVNDEGNSGKTTRVSCERNDVDGSIMFKVPFPATDTGGASRPDISMALNVVAFDLNANAQDPDTPTTSYAIHPSQTVTITAPEVLGEAFVGWNLDGSGMALAQGSDAKDKTIAITTPATLEGDEATIQALYVPVVKRIDVKLYGWNGSEFVMGGGATAPRSCTMSVEIANEYEIHPQNLKLSWSPAPKGGMFGGSFEYNTTYVATVQIVPYAVDGKVYVRPKGSNEAYSPIEFIFRASDNSEVSFNGDSTNTSYDVENASVSKVYTRMDTGYVLEKVKQPRNIEGVEYGTDANGISGLLPRTTKVLTKGGYEFDAVIEWGTPTDVTGTDDPFAERVWTVQGTVQLPDGVNQPSTNPIDLNVTLNVSVDAAETALMPSMSLPEGAYLTDQWSTLTTNEEGGTTYFTTSQKGAGDLVIEDPTDPNAARAELTDDNDVFSISRLRALPTTIEGFDEDDNLVEIPVKSVIVQAYTEAPGKRPSSVVTFEYQFRDIPVPEGQNSEFDGEEHLGVEANPYYTLSVDPDSSARVDEYGNVVATMPGTYSVTAELTLANDYWDAETASERTRDDQLIEFTISGDTPLSSCKLDVVANPVEGGTVSGAGTYIEDSDVTVKAWANEGYEFANWTVVSDDPELDGMVASEDFAYTFPIVGDLKLQANFAQQLTVRWLDADGNEIDSKVYFSSEDEPTTDAEPPKEADAQYTYTFAGWDLVDGDDATVKTYKPRYTQTVNKYEVVFVDDDGTVLKEAIAYPYGTAAAEIAKPADPKKADTAEYTYTFAGWSPAVAKVTGDATYKATYKASARSSEPTPTPEPTPKPEDRGKQQGSDGTSFGRGASIEAAEAALAAMTSDASPAGTTFSALKLKSVKQAKTNVKLAWSKVKGAKKYVLYGNKCGKKHKMIKIGTSTGKAKTVKKVAGKKLKKGTYYKFIVIALDENNDVVSTSKAVHVATSGALKKAANPQEVVVKKGKKTVSKVTVKKGKSVKLKGSYTKAEGSKVKKHVAVLFESTNTKIATVTKAGKIKGKKKGTCHVYAYAQNGISKRIKVTVK